MARRESSRRRSKRGESEARANIGVSSRSQELISMESLCAQKGASWKALSRARAPSGNSEKPQNEKERKRKRTYKSDKPPRERKRRNRKKDIGTFGGLKGGWRGKMAGAGDWGRSMNLRGKAWGGARQGRGVTRGGCLEGMPKGGRSTRRDGGGVLGRGQEVTRVRVCTYLSLVCILLYSRG